MSVTNGTLSACCRADCLNPAAKIEYILGRSKETTRSMITAVFSDAFACLIPYEDADGMKWLVGNLRGRAAELMVVIIVGERQWKGET